MKRCSKCGVEQPFSEFYKNRSRSDGLQHYCKPCKNSNSKVWHVANPEYDKAYQVANSEAIEEKRKAHYELNREAILERNKKWSAANPEKKIASNKKWSATNPEKVRAKEAKRRALQLQHGVSPDLALEMKAMLFFFRSCRKCGSTENLQVDHVVPLSRSGFTGIDNFQILCGPCNSGKSNRNSIDYRTLHERLIGFALAA